MAGERVRRQMPAGRTTGMRLGASSAKVAVVAVAIAVCGTASLAESPAVGQPARGAQLAPPQLTRLWQRLDDLNKEREQLAWQRWQALGVVEKARLILRHQNQPLPSQERLASVTEEEARRILEGYERKGSEGQRQLKAYYSGYTLKPEESVTFERRRKAVVGDIAGLGEGAIPVLIAEILNSGAHGGPAEQALGLMGTKPTSALLQALKTDAGRRHMTTLLEALAGTKDPRARGVFVLGLGDGDISVRRVALTGLENLGPVPQAVYLRCLEDADDIMRWSSIQGLEKAGDDKAIPALLEVARYDPEYLKGGFWLRRGARTALEQVMARTGTRIDLPPAEPLALDKHPYRSFEELAPAARCENAGIRQRAVMHLGNWVHERRTLKLLQEIIRRDPSEAVRGEAASGIGRLFYDSPPLKRLSLSPEESEEAFNFLLDLVQGDEGQVSTNAFRSIGSLLRSPGEKTWASFRRFPEFFGTVLQWIKGNDPERRVGGVLMISWLGYSAPDLLNRLMAPQRRSGLLPFLKAGIENPEVGVRIRFIEALGWMREPSVVPRLIELLRDEEDIVRYFAVDALGRIGDSRAVPALEKVAANDPARNPEGRLYMREEAQKMIEQIRASGAANE